MNLALAGEQHKFADYIIIIITYGTSSNLQSMLSSPLMQFTKFTSVFHAQAFIDILITLFTTWIYI